MLNGPALRIILIIAILSALSGQAMAQATPEERARADTLFEEAKSLMAQSRFLEACPKLEEARRIEPGAGGTVLALALCHEGEQKLATALTELRLARSMAQATHNLDRERLAAEHIEGLAGHVSRIVFKGMNEAMTVSVDGAKVSPEGVVEVDGGEHVARAESPGLPVWEQRISVATKDDTRVVELPLLPPVPPASAVHAPLMPQPIVPAGPRARASSRARIAGFITAGVGVVATAVGSYYGVSALQAESDSKARCATNPCSSVIGVRRHADAQRDALIADLGIGLGLAAVTTGVLLAVIGRRSATHTLHVTPTASERSLGIVVGARF